MNLKAKLDRIFSEFIRLRDTDENGIGRCVSCGKIIHWKDGDAGHFVNRKHLSLRYDEKNVNLQCRSCNRFDEGNNTGYYRGLVFKYGYDVIDYLAVKKYNYCHLGEVEYEALIEEYKEKVKQLKLTKI